MGVKAMRLHENMAAHSCNIPPYCLLTCGFPESLKGILLSLVTSCQAVEKSIPLSSACFTLMIPTQLKSLQLSL